MKKNEKSINNSDKNTAKRESGEKEFSDKIEPSDLNIKFLSENMLDLFCLHDSKGHYCYVSPVVTELLGYEPSELIDRSPLDFIHPEDLINIKKISYYPLAKKGKEDRIEYRFRKKDDNYIWLETLTRIVYNNSGKVVQLQTSSRDISRRKIAEQKLIENELMYRTHYKNLPMPTYTWVKSGDDFIFTDFNDQAERVSDRNLSKALGKTTREVFVKKPYISDYIRRCYEEKRPITSEETYEMNKTGDMKFLIISYIYIPPEMVVIHIENITEKKKSEEEIRNLARFPEDNPNPVFRVNSGNEVIYSNNASEWLIENWECGIGKSIPDFVSNTVERVIKLNDTVTMDVSIKGRVFNFTVSPVAGMNEVYFYGLDVTDKKMTEEELLLIGKVFETTTEGIVVTDSQNKIIRINPAFTTITGYTREEVIGKNPRILKSERHNLEFYRSMWESLLETGIWMGEIWNRRKSGETYPEWLSINVIKDEMGRVKNYVSVFRDISDLKNTEQKIEYQAYHDPLTDLPNRALFSDRLLLAVNQASRNGNKMALVYIDLDRFKIINDSLGHITGDYLLQNVARRLMDCVRDGDTVARVGGDEFVIILPYIDEINDVVRVCGRIRDNFKSPVKIDENELFVSASIGISIFPDDGDTVAELHKNADIAMYHAKALGGGEYQFFSVEMNSEVDVRLMLEMQLRKAIEQDQFEIYFQPIVDSRTGKTQGVEALARWVHPELGILPPSTFIPVAEETGHIVHLNDIILKKACTICRDIIDMGYGPLYVSVNMTSHQFNNKRILYSIRSVIEELGLNPEYLIIEITEESILDNVEEINEIMKELKRFGIKFSIDDFGTGYSSLSYLKRFPIDNLKIDRSFIVDIPEDNDSKTLARTIIVLARELGLKVIAEGVEKQEQLDFFTQNGEYLIQGYYFSRPLKANDLVEFLNKSK